LREYESERKGDYGRPEKLLLARARAHVVEIDEAGEEKAGWEKEQSKREHTSEALNQFNQRLMHKIETPRYRGSTG
jgi:hypothetical protein